MKKLVKFLVPLISLLFIINVKANTITSIGYGAWEGMYDKVESHLTLFANVRQFLLNTERITESDILITPDAFASSSQPNPTGFNVCKISSNISIISQNTSIYFNNCYSFSFDTTTYEVTYISSYYITGINLLRPNYTGRFVWFGGNEDTTLTITNNVVDTNFILDPTTDTANNILEYGQTMNLFEFASSLMGVSSIVEPTYSYEETILENGNVKLDFTFTNYNENSGYAFEVENGISNEEYGITNTYSNIFPNQIPFGTSYSIELPFDTYLYVTLAKYEQVEDTSLYYKEEIYTHIIDINNIVFENKQDPYFVIYRQNKNLIEGSFANTTSQNTCWYRYSTSQNEDFVPCDELLGLSFYDNGYVEVIIKKGSQTIYSRKINYLGSNQNEPYIKYEVVKQDFYSIVNWSTENYVNNLTFRYSVDNGINYTTWSIYNNNQNYYINVFDNSTIIIEIANSDQTTIYDSKAIIVVNDINTIKNINNTTTNFIDKFKSLFSINGNILNNVSNFYDNIKLSKVYLLIFIPFLTSLIAGIIYLIRRK